MEKFNELLQESLKDHAGNANHTSSAYSNSSSVSSRSSIGNLGSSTFGSLNSSASNGLSCWYDNLRNDPAKFYIASS
jgi:hypothetical protein